MTTCRALAFAITGVVAPPVWSDEPAPPFMARWETNTSFQTKDPALQRLNDAAERVLSSNLVRFTPSMNILVEGGGYPNAWIETQPMGGEMYAKRDPQVALNNQLIFLLAQQLDAMTGAPSGQKPDGYGPMALAALEYLSRTQGIHIDVANHRVWWSSADPAAADFNHTQRWGEHRFELRHSQGKMEALVGDKPVFICDAGIRVITDLKGNVLELAGISPEKQELKLLISGQTHPAIISPNEVLKINPTGVSVKCRVPFAYPNKLSEP